MMRLRAWSLLAVAVLAAAAAAPASAQSSPGIEARFVVGIGLQGGVFGDNRPRPSWRIGVTIGGQVRWKPEQRTGLVLDLALQPLSTKNPHFDENLRTFTVHMAPEIGRTIYVRPGAGIALHLWSGRSAESGFKIAPSVGLAVGARRTLTSGIGFTPEFFSRASIEHGALAWMLGGRVPVSWRR